MSKAGAVNLLRRIAALMLVACFLLPLSQCAQKVPPDGQPATPVASSLSGVDLLQEGWTDLRTAQIAKGMAMLLAVFNVFFLPAACLGLRERLRAVLYLLASLGAAWWLYVWVFMFTQPRMGGLIASACWVVLFFTSSVTLFSGWRRRPGPGPT